MQSRDQASFVLDADTIWVKSNTPASPDDKSLATIGEVAAEFDVSPRALRFYESKGLMSPLRKDGMRLYSKKDRERLALVLKAKRFGFVLGEIPDMINAQEGRAVGQSLKISREKCGEQIDLLQRQLEEVSEAIAELRRFHTLLSGPTGHLGLV
jgi:DNA-binding transcriptional MerR regulator